MKNIYFTLIFLLSVFLASCDKIDDPYTLPVPVKAWYGKKVLIEDYTGHKCPNCPGAAVDANNLKNLYGEKVIVLAVHAGFFAKPAPPTLPEDFRTLAGDAWNTFFGFTQYPNGMINRKGYPNTHIAASGDWAGKTALALAEIPEIELLITKTYNPSDSSISGKVTASFLKTIKKKLKLQIVITEDSIIAPQINATTTIPDYVHRHMLRASVNGDWGSTLTDGNSFSLIDTELSHNYQYSLKATPLINYKIKHCSIIAFVYDDVTKEILQVEEKHIY
jgi:hypothetical protein